MEHLIRELTQTNEKVSDELMIASVFLLAIVFLIWYIALLLA